MKLFDEPAKQCVDIMKASAGGRFLPLGCDAQRAVVQHPKIATVGFDHAVAGRSGSRRIHAQNAAEGGSFGVVVVRGHPR